MLFPRQQVSHERILSYLRSNDNRPGIVVGPTGYGKSHIISSVAHEFDGPILVIQPSGELLKQNLGKLIEMGGSATVYSASMGIKEASVLTYATLKSIKHNAALFKSLGVKTVLVDECDHGYSPKAGSEFSKFIKELAPTKIVGYTATPFSLEASRNRFGDNIQQLKMINLLRPKIFKHFIDIVQIHEVIGAGRWTKLSYITHKFDTGELQYNTTGNEFTEKSIKKAMEVNGVNNNIYLRIKELLLDKSKNILVFVDSIENAEKFASLFDEAEVLSDKTKKKDRASIIENFKDLNHKTRVVFNFGILTTGFDFPALNHIFIGRPTNSLRLYYQIIGRVVRLFEGKEVAYVEDLCGNIERFGYIENLTIEDYPGYGWGVFNGETLITGTPLDAVVKKTKESLRVKPEDGMKFTFGKYKGQPVASVGRGYLEFQANWIDTLSDPAPSLRKLREYLRAIL